MGRHPDPDPDPEITQLLALLDAYESFPEDVQPVGPLPQPPGFLQKGRETKTGLPPGCSVM